MVRVNEFTPLLADRPASPRRRLWPYIVGSVLGVAFLLSFVQESPVDQVLNTVTLDANDANDAEAFVQNMEAFKDPSVDPCADFYQYACGGWLASHDVPEDQPSIDASFYVVSEQNKQTIQRIFDQKPPQIGELYGSCLNDAEVDADAVAFVAQLIDKVHAAESTIKLMQLAGELDQSLGISTFFSIFVGADPRDPNTNVLQLSQGGLTLPSREYYLEQSKVDQYAALFVDYVTKLFAVGELDKHNVSAYAQAVLETETALAKVSLPNAALRNPWTTSTSYPYAEIAQRYPFVMAYLNGINSKEPFPMLHAIVATPDFFDAQNELLKDDALLPQLKNYMSFHLIDSFGAVLGEYFRRASHEFHGPIQGAGALLPRDQFCVRLTTAFLGDQLGVYYMQYVFGPDAKAAAQALVAEVEESLKALLTTEAWLDKVTYDAAVTKLSMVKNYIGGPDEVPPLPFTLQADAFFNNVRSLMELSAKETIRAVGQPVNPKAWDMFPSTVNAYYDPSANKMVFPAAILQPPFYSAEHFPAAANFARIGMVMGHELSHGFDDQGRNFDGTGALRSWWTPAVSEEFAEKAQCLSAQYSTFPVVSIEDGHVLGTINGNLTLGENIADNGGIHLAFEAYQLWKSTFATAGSAPGTEAPPQLEPAPVETPAPADQTPEPTETPIVSPGEQPTEPPQEGPNEDIPAVTPPPVIPIPDEPVPEPTETGPGEQIPVTLPPPVLPVPDAETPVPAETEPSGEIPVATPSPPTVVPEPQPDVGPGEIIPETPEPADTEPATEIPTPPAPADIPIGTLPPSEPATEAPVETSPPEPATDTPVQTPTPTETEPATETPVDTPASTGTEPPTEAPVETPPTPTEPVPSPPVPEEPTTPPSAIPIPIPEVPTPAPSPSSEVPEHHHKKESETEKHKKSDKSHHDDKSGEEHKHSTEKHEKEDERSSRKSHEKHSDERDKDEETHESPKDKHAEKRKKDEEEEHKKHQDDEDNESGKKHHKDEEKHETSKSDKHQHKEDGEHESHKHKHDEDKDSDKHTEDKHERSRREKERDADEKESGHGKHEKEKHEHHGHSNREEDDRGKHERDDENSGRRLKHHHNHEDREDTKEERKEERRERDERKKERKEEHEQRKEERKEQKREERKERRDEREEERERHHRHKHDDDREWKSRRHGCGDDDECGRHELLRSESTFPFSGGNARIHSMVEKLARSLVQPNDPVADDRLFFTAFAQNWCEKRSPAYAELLRMIDPHSPGKWRVNGPLMNYDKFAEVFNCPVGSPMNPEKKCVIW